MGLRTLADLGNAAIIPRPESPGTPVTRSLHTRLSDAGPGNPLAIPQSDVECPRARSRERTVTAT
jgi:hypothetical protein